MPGGGPDPDSSSAQAVAGLGIQAVGTAELGLPPVAGHPGLVLQCKPMWVNGLRWEIKKWTHSSGSES
jgi:hypothetical protein